MRDDSPRYWDGRVREVVAVRYAPRVISASSPARIETLSCGHEKVPHFKKDAGGNPGGKQYRICWECPGSTTEGKRMTPQPAIGRMVHFHEEGGPYASTITAINEDGTLELATFGRNSLYFQHGVKESPSTEKPVRGTWTWPPFVPPKGG